MSATGEAQVFINAPADLIFKMLTDVTRMGEWSPECRACEWIGEPRRPVVGAMFRGTNRFRIARWTRSVKVTAVEPGRRFEFTTQPSRLFSDSTRWEYRLVSTEGGTQVIESYEVLRPASGWIVLGQRLVGRSRDRTPSMYQTLAALKAAAERQARASLEQDRPSHPRAEE